MASAAPDNAAWGRFEYSLDDKNRVLISPRLRWFFDDGAVMTIGAPNHIRIYRKESWEKLTRGFDEFGLASEMNHNIEVVMQLLGNCETVSLDRENRLTIPRFFKSFAGLNDGDFVAAVALGNRIELWSRSKWDQQYAAISAEQVAMAYNEAYRPPAAIAG